MARPRAFRKHLRSKKKIARGYARTIHHSCNCAALNMHGRCSGRNNLHASFPPRMLRNFLTTSFRKLWRNRLYTLINLLGLGIGIACFVLVVMYVRYERSFDRFVPQADRVYRVVGEIEMEGQGERSSSMVFGLGPTLLNDHPEL